MANGSKKGKSIFKKARLKPAQLKTVADRRFDDASMLQKSGENERANGAMYLAGFVVECLLKAALLIEYPWLGSAGTAADRTEDEKRLWSLCYRSHDLDEILSVLPRVDARLREFDQKDRQGPSLFIKQICAEWTIFARYSPRSATIQDAATFVSKVKEIKKCLG